MSERRHGRGDPPPRSVDEDVSREIRFHLEMRTRELIAAGHDPDSARRAAERAFGNVGRIAGECREITRATEQHRSLTRMFDSLAQDLKYAFRTLSRSPGFTAVAVLTLALGIGANTAIFSVVDGVLLTPLPYDEPDRLVAVWEASESGDDNHVAWANFVDWRQTSQAFAGLAAHPSYEFGGATTVLGGDEPRRLRVAAVSEDFFASVFPLSPAAGRLLGGDDHRLGATPVAVVSHAFWRDQLGSTERLADRPLRISGRTVEIVGVAPPGFDYPAGTQVWYPTELSPKGLARTSHNFALTGRLKRGVTPAEAEAELDAVTAALKEEYGEDMNAVGVNLRSLREEMLGDVEGPLWLLLGAAGLVLLVACSNLASTLMARGSAREREVAVRASVGAGRGRLVRQLLTESVMLAVLGAAAGAVLGTVVLRSLLALAPAAVPRTATVGMDGSVLAFTLAVAVVTAIAFGLLPALRSSRTELRDALGAAGRGNAGDDRGGAWKALVVTEVALALVLLIGAGLLLRSFYTLVGVDPGFEAEEVLTADISLPATSYPANPDVAAFHERFLDRVRGIPGVEAAGIVNHLPLSGSWLNGRFEIEDRGPSGSSTYYRVASAGYFDALRIPLLRGRPFDDPDREGAPHVALVNQAMANRFWPGEDPVGRRIRNLANDGWVYPDEWITIIGVVGNTRHTGLTEEPVPAVYVHYLQRPFRARSAAVTIRTSGDPMGLAGPVRSLVGQIDDDVPVETGTLQELVAGSTADSRFVMLVLGTFALVGLVLAAVGIHGVVSYAVARRTREMGIRLALGAAPGAVRRLVIRDAMGMVLAGLALGVAGALGLTRVMESLLWRVSPTDPMVFAAVLALLGGTGWLASLVPALRGSRVDPMITMRGE